jgi:hypothetical protein
MVHAAKEPAAIRAAIARGDFYSSTACCSLASSAAATTWR